MFKNTYQSGLLSVFSSVGSHPLGIWEPHVKNGHVKRITDEDVKTLVLEIVGTNVATTYITCPRGNKTLGIRLPFLVMILKNLKRYFSFEITILDDKGIRRRFRISNFQSTTKIKTFCTTMPIGLAGGWNQIQFNLADFTRRAYGSQFLEAVRIQIHANARLRRIYFSDRLYLEDELPQDYKLYLPLDKKSKKLKKDEKKEEEKKEEPTAPSAKLSKATIPDEKEKPAEASTGEAPPAEPEAKPEPAPEPAPAPEVTEAAPEGEAAEGVAEEAAPGGEGEAGAEGEGGAEGEAGVDAEVGAEGEVGAEVEGAAEGGATEGEAAPGEAAPGEEVAAEGEAPAEPAEEPAAEGDKEAEEAV